MNKPPKGYVFLTWAPPPDSADARDDRKQERVMSSDSNNALSFKRNDEAQMRFTALNHAVEIVKSAAWSVARFEHVEIKEAFTAEHIVSTAEKLFAFLAKRTEGGARDHE